MANPALKNGYFSIANELAEQFALKNIPGNEMRLLWVVLRKTWGWKKDVDDIAFSQFQKATDMKNGNIARGLKSLVAKRLVIKTENGYKPNQNYEEWVLAKRLPGSQKARKRSQKDKKKVAKRMDTKERNTLSKETIATGEHIEKARHTRDLIEAFSKINPAAKRLYGNTSERKACEDLVELIGFERAMMIVTHTLPKTNTIPYMPTILTPYQLFRDFAKLEAAIMKEKGKAKSKERGYAEKEPAESGYA